MSKLNFSFLDSLSIKELDEKIKMFQNPKLIEQDKNATDIQKHQLRAYYNAALKYAIDKKDSLIKNIEVVDAKTVE